MSGVLQFRVSWSYPDLFWKILGFNQTHVEWFGCSLHDTIQPGFSFLAVGLVYSIASACGCALQGIFFHAMWRSLVLVAWAVSCSMDHSMSFHVWKIPLADRGYPFCSFSDSVHRSRDGRVGRLIGGYSWDIG